MPVPSSPHSPRRAAARCAYRAAGRNVGPEKAKRPKRPSRKDLSTH